MATTSTSITARESNEVGVRYYDVVICDKKIKTTVTSNPKPVRDWIHGVEFNHRSNTFRLVIGLDIKFASAPPSTAAASSSSAPPRRPISLLLLFYRRSCLIYQLAHATDIPCILPQFLSSRSHTFAGVGDIQSKLFQLSNEYGTGGRAWNHDLPTLSAARFSRPDLQEAGLSELRAFFYGSDVERPWPPVVGDWDAEHLSIEHVRHATIDAYTCYEIGSYLIYPVKRGTLDYAIGSSI